MNFIDRLSKKKKYSNIKFHENPSNKNRVALCRKTDKRIERGLDRREEANICYLQFFERARKCVRQWHWNKFLSKRFYFPVPVPFHPYSFTDVSCIHHRRHITLTRQALYVLTFWRRTFFFQILAHPVFKMWVIQKPIKVALWNKRHFEGEKNGDYTACLKYSVRIFVE